jgi:glycosyltransferase involved in cell wall biosynthesis
VAKTSEALIIIPAFNEEGSIASVLCECRKYVPGVDLVVINDGSRDRTEEICISNNINVINLCVNLGVGTALQTGYKYAHRKGYKYLIQLDADGQHDPSNIPAILSALIESGYDFVIASRFKDKNKYTGGRVRNIGIFFFSRILSMIIKEKLTDPTSGFRGMNDKILEYCVTDNYNFEYPDANFILALHKAGFKFKEVPVIMRQRKFGKSQHAGLKPIYYVLKMILSLFIVSLRSK